MRAGGPYELTAVLSRDDVLRASFERKAGGWPGDFELRRNAK
jgi:hypothetical protein